MSRWPRDNQSELIAFYGDPGTGAVARQLVPYVPPFKMYYEGTPVKHLMLHRKCVDAFQMAFEKIWDYYGHDQKIIDQLHISRTAGTYNCRKIRGSATKWSNHAYGGALDLDAENNGFNAKNTIPLPVIAAFKSEGMRWGGDYTGRKDPMHFECCQGRDPARTFEGWLKFYGQPLQYMAPVGIADMSADVPANGVATEDTALPEGEAHYTEEQLSAPPATKSLLKSKLNWVMQALGLGGGGAVLSSDNDLQTTFTHLVTNPRFLWLVIIVLLVGAGMYFYWRDYGKGSQR
jgi:hypothetical protein